MNFENKLKQFCAERGLILKDDAPELKKNRIKSDVVYLDGCNLCGKCCELVNIVELSYVDAIRIAVSLGKKVSDLFEQEGDNYYITDTHPCKFLNTSSDKGYCGIHGIKPELCKKFPVIEDDEGNEFVVNYSYCNLCLVNAYKAIERGREG